MKQLEIDTSINSKPGHNATQLASKIVDAQIASNIINDIVSARRNLKPWRPRQLCQYPFPPRIDDFNVSRGLGSVSLKPCIDSLNNFKNNCIKEIKTKFQAMGPESAKDSKLAIGAVELIKEVLDAAQCFTQIVTNINNLINGYIQAIDLMAISLNKNINNLTNEVQQIKIDILAFPFEITDEVIKDSLNLLQRETNIFTMLVLVGQIQKQIGILQKQSTSISKSPKKLLLHLEASITLLQGSLRNLQYAMSCRDILNSNKSYAQNSYMVDDFLDDFNYSDVQAASYNWSITNSAALLNYNTIDEKHIIPQLNNLFQNYTASTGPLLIDSSSQEGTIIVPDGSEGLISVGIDSRLSINIGIILQLVINKGETVVIAESYGSNLVLNPPINLEVGKYYSKEIDTFIYDRIDVISGSPNSCKLYNLESESTSNFTMGDYFYIKDSQFLDYSGYYQVMGGGTKYYAPILYKIISVEHNCIEVIPANSDFDPTAFYPNLPDQNYDPFVASIDPYTLLESIYSYDNTSGIQQTLYKYTFSSSQTPHAGEKIKCNDWQLYITVAGDPTEIRKVSFSRTNITDTESLFAIKAHWGFIPNS